jgi:hypothetical protein
MANAATVMLVAVLAGTILWQIVQAPGVGPWLKDWQTLVAGIFAVAAAAVSAYLLNRQTRQTERLARNDWQSRREATRSVLPIGLAEIDEYARDCGRAMLAILALPNGPVSAATLAGLPKVPSLPERAIQLLREMTELSDPDEAAVIAQIPALMQYQWARIVKVPGEIGSNGRITALDKLNWRAYAIDAAMVFARSEALFDFGRRRAPVIKRSATYRRVISGLNQMGFNDVTHSDIYEVVLARASGNLDTPIRDIEEQPD